MTDSRDPKSDPIELPHFPADSWAEIVALANHAIDRVIEALRGLVDPFISYCKAVGEEIARSEALAEERRHASSQADLARWTTKPLIQAPQRRRRDQASMCRGRRGS